MRIQFHTAIPACIFAGVAALSSLIDKECQPLFLFFILNIQYSYSPLNGGA